MKKLFSILTTFSLLSFLLTSQVFALTLDNIGSSATATGNPGTEWYYTAQNPSLSGTAQASDTVTIDIDGTPVTTSSDGTGAWSYQPSTLTTGDHTITVSDTISNLSFTIHIGQSVPTTKGGTTASPSALPVSGAITNTLMLLGGGSLMVYAGLKLRKATVEA